MLVLWKDLKGLRRVIGDLWRTSDGGYAFGYRDDLPSAGEGWLGLIEFPEHRTYRASYLFPTFAQRIPGPGRPDRIALLRAWGVVNEDDDLEILARSGGVQETDRIELAELSTGVILTG